MAEKGIILPVYQSAVYNYVKAQRHGDVFYIGDHVGQTEEGFTVRAKNHLGGDLDKVIQVIKIDGYVNGHDAFQKHDVVINGCSDVLVEVLGDRGKHARTCIGAGSSPAAVTCDMIVQVRD